MSPHATHPRASGAEEAATRTVQFRAMASSITVQLEDPGPGVDAAVKEVEARFRRIEAACTRFDANSPLMRANRAGCEWAAVPHACHTALVEAARAHRETGGLFDPRVLGALVDLGYDTSLPFQSESVQRPAAAASPAPLDGAPWVPGFDAGRVRIGLRPVDLGGIGKGLAVRLASECLKGVARAHRLDAGGDLHVSGAGPRGEGWRIGVEDPLGGGGPVAVLALQDTGCATSSLRVRRWRAGGAAVHHLIDPRTGRSAEGGLAAVTVVGLDPARDEAWAKALLIAGAKDIAALAEAQGLAALWVDAHGCVGHSSPMRRHLVWLRGEQQTEAAASHAAAPSLPPHLVDALRDRAAMLALLERLSSLERGCETPATRAGRRA